MGVKDFTSLIWQPKGGFLPIRLVEESQSDYKEELMECENIEGFIMGMLVEGLFRLELGVSLEDIVFWAQFYENSPMSMEWLSFDESHQRYLKYKSAIKKGLSDDSIIALYQLMRMGGKYENKLPNKESVHNARVMTKRTLAFFKDKIEETQVQGVGYIKGETKTLELHYAIDILTKNGIWDLKVHRGRLNKNHTMQVYLYSLLLNNPNIDHIGLFNARTNTGYKLTLNDINKFTKGYVISSSIEQALEMYSEGGDPVIQTSSAIARQTKEERETKTHS